MSKKKQKDPARTVYLVSCVKTKNPKKAQAQYLYGGNWFTKAKAYVEQTGSPWFILSAKYGLLSPTKQIKPYEKTLIHMKKPERQAWAEKVQGQMEERVPEECTKVVILAGSKYREFLMDYLTDRFKKIKIPLEGITFGNQLKWFDKHLGTAKAKTKKSGTRKAKVPTLVKLTKQMEKLW